MRKSLIILLGAALAGLLATGCDLEAPGHSTLTVEQPSGAAVFGNYVAAGNSLTAGFMDGGLMMAGQATSFPQLIATQMGYPAGSFMQPLLASPGLGTRSTGDPMIAGGVLRFDATTGMPTFLGTTPVTSVPSLLLTATWPVPFSNLGVPGATLLDFSAALDRTTSQAPGNAFFDLVLRNPTFGNKSMRDQLIARGPTIATLWLGNNDVLGGATSGQPNDGVLYPAEDVNLTPPALFGPMYADMLDSVLDGVENRHGFRPLIFTANIPSITSVPYFMPTAMFRQVAGLPDAGTLPVFTEEADAPLVIFLDAMAYLGAGGTLPLPAATTLSAAETQLVGDTVDAYNAAIAAAVDARPEVFLYDANAALAALNPMAEGAHFLVLAGSVGPVTAAQTTLFSLDGIHPNNRGYGVVANGFLATMNASLGTDFPMVDVGALTWDPTYGVGYGTGKAAESFSVTPEMAAAAKAIFR